MNRREFLKKLGIGVAAAPVIIKLGSLPPEPDLSDIGNHPTLRVNRSGTVPIYSFSSDSNVGWYLHSNGDLEFTGL